LHLRLERSSVRNGSGQNRSVGKLY
jgi:hypothetical protein